MSGEAQLAALLRDGGVDEQFIARLAHFGGLLLDENQRVNLTGAKTPADLAPHLLESLSVVPYLRTPHVDIGSGGGFPAIPAALVGGFEVTLVEATVKKARFLERLLEELDIRGRVVAERAEVAGRDEQLRERFATGTARAVGPAASVAELLMPFLRVGGEAVLQRGQVEAREREVLADAALMLGGEMPQMVQLDGGRCILIVRKTSPTSIRFPRRTGIPAKRPLCT